jgi:hypothetical protein
MEKLGDLLVRHFDGIAAYCDHPVRFGVGGDPQRGRDADGSRSRLEYMGGPLDSAAALYPRIGALDKNGSRR